MGFTGFVVSEFLELRRESRHKKTLASVTSGVLNEKDPLLNQQKIQESSIPRTKWWQWLLKYLF